MITYTLRYTVMYTWQAHTQAFEAFKTDLGGGHTLMEHFLKYENNTGTWK